jgi:Uma2 family endonuclease
VTAVTRLDHYTVADLESTPDDGQRYEVINGTLLVTPPPFMPHNKRATAVGGAFLQAAPPDLEVCVTSTAGVQIGEDCLVPDVVVYRAGDYQGNLPAEAVVLVVEVTSPSNRSNDTVLKLDRYARAGIPHYWVVDPDTITVYALEGDSYRTAATGRAVRVTEPFDAAVALPR